MHRYIITSLLLFAITVTLVHANVAINNIQDENNATASTECEHKDAGSLDERDRVLVSLTRALDSIEDSLTEDEKDLLADLLDSETCTDEMVEEVIDEYEKGTLYSGRSKRSTCEVTCKRTSSSVNCSGRRCKCKCNFWGRAKCKCCSRFGFC